MADEIRPPVAIRSLRPYSTEDAFLAEERDTLTRTAVTLIGAPSRPRGVVIRFELTLSDGTPLVRGEGRVLGFQPPDEHGPSSLTLRFTRLDAKSKALVDRAAELREAASGRPSEAVTVGSDTEPPVAPELDLPPSALRDSAKRSASPFPGAATGRDALAATSTDLVAHSPTEPPPASEELIALSISSGNLPLMDVEEIGVARTDAPPPIPAPADVDRVALAAPVPAPEPTPPPASSPADSVRRDTLLDRLRTRAKTLSPTQVATILAVPRPTS